MLVMEKVGQGKCHFKGYWNLYYILGQKISFSSEMAHIYIFIFTYHSGTVDSSCWWYLSSQPEFLHVSKLEWALYMTHTLLRQKTQITNTVHSFAAVIHGNVK